MSTTSSQRDSLREYQADILRKMADARQATGVAVDLSFGFTADGRGYLINGLDVLEVVSPSQLEPLPMAKPWVLGAANIKGAVYTVTDFSVLLGGPPTRRGKFLILHPRLVTGAALMIEAIAGLFERSQLGAPQSPEPGLPPWLTSAHTLNGNVFHAIDGRALAADNRFSKLQRGDDK